MKSLNIYATDEFLADLDYLVKSLNLSRSQVIRDLVSSSANAYRSACEDLFADCDDVVDLKEDLAQIVSNIASSLNALGKKINKGALKNVKAQAH